MPPYVQPMFSKKIFTAQNPDASKAKYHKLGTSVAEDEPLEGGVCCAMCLLWFKRIFQSHYNNVMWALVDDGRAAKGIFLQYMMAPIGKTPWARKIALFANHGMTLHMTSSAREDRYAGDILKDGGRSAEEWIKATPELTCFNISVTAHAMAGFWKRGEAFFFDPNEGVFQLPDINDFADQVPDSIYQNYLKGTDSSIVIFNKITIGSS